MLLLSPDKFTEKVRLKTQDVAKKEKKRKRKVAESEEAKRLEEEESRKMFELAPLPSTDITFLQMNLYPPILKVYRLFAIS